MKDDKMPETMKVLTAERPNMPPPMVVQTPGAEMPNVQLVPTPIWKLVFVRTARTYLQGVAAGLPTAALMPGTAGAIADVTVDKVAQALGLSFGPIGSTILLIFGAPLVPAFATLIHNLIELLNGWDVTSPGIRA